MALSKRKIAADIECLKLANLPVLVMYKSILNHVALNFLLLN